MTLETAANRTSGRIEWIDLTKGIAMLLVIIGHSCNSYFWGNVVRGTIFSFHMPLFFILSCVTCKWSTDNASYLKNLKKAAKHLLIPAAVAFLIALIAECIKDPSLILSAGFWNGKLYTLIFSNGVSSTFSSLEIPPIRNIWFLIALFIGRSIFDYLHMVLNEKQFLIASMAAGLIGIGIGQVYCLPFSLDIALAVIPLMYFGYKLHYFNPEKHTWIKLFVCLLIWAAVIYITYPDWQNQTYLEFTFRRYSLFPICYIGAIAGTLFFGELSIILCRIKYVFKPLIFVGRYSLYLFCIHFLDNIWSGLWEVEGRQFISSAKRLVVDLIIFAAFMALRYLFKKITGTARLKTSR